MAYTNGFGSAYVLTLKFKKHGHLLGAATEQDYLTMADTFLGGPLTAHMRECTRAASSKQLRFNEARQRFGILLQDNVICTFYQFDPPPPPARTQNWFTSQCARTD